MPVVNPGVRRGIGSFSQRVFNAATLSLPLTHTVVPVRGTLTPSFTRATAETGQKWDESGYLDFTALSGEVVFKGARREYNQWTTSSVSLANGNNKSLTLTAGTFQFSMGAGTGTATFSGTGGATGTLAASASARVSVAKTISAGTLVITASVADLADLQVCDITGETDQTTIRPYVSVGVLSAPAYNGSCVPGVQCFPTDRSGNSISRTGSYPLVGYVPWELRQSIIIQSSTFDVTWADTSGACSATKNLVGPDRVTNSGTTLNNSGGALGGKTQNVTLTAASWTYSAYFYKTVGAQPSYPVMFPQVGAVGAACTVDTSNGIATVFTSYPGFTIQPSSAICVSHNSLWWRVSLTFTATAAVWAASIYSAATSNATQSSGAITGVVNKTCGIYGAQVELGAFSTPYIPTTTIAVTRNADILSYTGADVANYKSMKSTFSRAVGVSNVGGIVGLSDGTANERNHIFINSATAAGYLIYDGGVLQVNVSSSNAYVPGLVSKMSESFATNDVKIDKDGTATTDADLLTATMPTVTQIQIGHINSANILNGQSTDHYFWLPNRSQSELGAVDR